MVSKYIQKILRFTGILLLVFLSILLAVFTVNAGTQSDLQSWHEPGFPEDNLCTVPYSSFEEYLAVEQDYINSIYDSLAEDSHQQFIKYTEDDVFSPVVGGENLNASFVFYPRGTVFRGGVLLVHGLSDSPYQMREIGSSLSDKGYYVIGLRLPGHGTVPSALIDIRWQDWYQAVEFASDFVRHEISRRGSGVFIMGGFSTGAALNLRYTMKHIIEGKKDLPDKLMFFSPAFGITPLAELTSWHEILSWIPFLYKFKWQSVEPEYDPFRYTSWPFNAGNQIYRLTKKNWKLVDEITENPEYLEKFPPMIGFQSRVDATVLPEKVYEIFNLMAPEGSKLFLFDVNREYSAIMSEEVLDWSESEIPGERVGDMIRRIPGDSRWPESIYALSHISIPFSPENPFYGENSLIGGLSIKGERGVLGRSINPERLRYNPFFSCMEEEMLDFISP